MKWQPVLSPFSIQKSYLILRTESLALLIWKRGQFQSTRYTIPHNPHTHNQNVDLFLPPSLFSLSLALRLSLIGYHIGQRLLSLHYHRLESPASSLTGSSLASAASKAKPSKRETRLLPVLRWIHSQLWKAAFGKVADNLERSTENPDECKSL